MSLVEQNLSTIGQAESAVAKILALFLIGGDVVVLNGLGRSLLAELLSNTLGISLTDDSSDVRKGILGPDGDLTVLLVDELTGDSTNVVDDSLRVGSLGLVLLLEDLLEDTSDSVDVTSLDGLEQALVFRSAGTGEGGDVVVDELGVGDDHSLVGFSELGA